MLGELGVLLVLPRERLRDECGGKQRREKERQPVLTQERPHATETAIPQIKPRATMHTQRAKTKRIEDFFPLECVEKTVALPAHA